jgi:import inner membrane translocase subunit TIM16
MAANKVTRNGGSFYLQSKVYRAHEMLMEFEKEKRREQQQQQQQVQQPKDEQKQSGGE